ALGLTVVQHSLDLVDLGVGARRIDDEATAVSVAARRAGLVVASTFTGLALYSRNLLLDPDPAARTEAERSLAQAIEFTAALGGTATGGHVGAFSVADWNEPRRRTELWDGLRVTLAKLARRARDAGLECLLVENLAAAREPSTMAMIDEILDDGDEARAPIRLCLDVGHMCVPGTAGDDRDPYAWARRFGRRSPIVQLQQSDAHGDHHWPFTPDRNLAGRIEADRLIDALGEAGVEAATLVLEVIPPFEQDDDGVVDDLVVSVGYWREALVRRGVAAG
ncbi:MAG TPA: TIM barrel protein, partial [Candidatus Limnocylindrales bacterium]|nr:TIM barrel protein [Candidatus Limnocylindrales bacterium]